MGKKFLRDINVSLLLLIVISLFCSCTGEMNIFEGNNNKQINFSVSVPVWNNTDSLATTKTSRAMPITDTSFGTDKSFNLIADQNDGAGNYNTLIDKESVSFINNIWQTTPSHYYWSGITNKTINFYAYYPSTISNVNHIAGSSPTLSYTVPDNVSDQIDIMTATNNNVNGNTNSSTPLTFNHIFAAIQFSVGSNGIGSGTISSISIGNVANSGTYTFGSGWSNVTGSKTFTILQSKTIAGTSGEDIYSGTYTLMMIPQIINNVTITITYSNGSALTKTISGTWEAGKIYKYNLFYASRTFDYTGTVQTYTAPVTGTYKLEVWGAQGVDNIAYGGKGGYSYGNIFIKQNTYIYICVGGQGYIASSTTDISKAGYNGGGSAQCCGGGATHLATTNRGTLSNYVSCQAEILIVAGGGGGADCTNGGSGGGMVGGDASGTGGTQSTGGNGIGLGSFGQGGCMGFTNGDSGSGGGGGWYGGGSSTSPASGGGGGSGHLGSNLISGTTGMSNGVRSGNGYARITFVSAN